jgi:hypothetical protein
MRNRIILLAGLAAIPISASAQVVDGTISLSEGYTASAIQNNATNFGDNFNELDGMFLSYNGASLNIGITGNLASGNAIVMLFDLAAGGSNVLSASGGGTPGYISGQNGTIFDSGFTPDVAICVNRFNNDVFYDLVVLPNGGGAFLGTHAISGGGTIGTGPAFFDNSNSAGVGGGTVISSGASATTGLELGITLVAPQQTAKVMAYLSNNGDGFMSNQVLGGLGGGFNNLAFGGGSSGASQINFQNIAGDQCLTVTNSVPEPATMAALGLGALAAIRRRKTR